MSEWNAKQMMKLSKEELIDLLGAEKAKEVKEKIQNGTISYQELMQAYNDAFPNVEQAHVVQNLLMLKLSKSEVFNLVESDPVKQKQFAEITDLKEKAQGGKITEKDLNRLCELAFGDDKETAKMVHDALIHSGKVKKDREDDVSR